LPFLDVVRDFVNRPFVIIQDFGFFGVVLFFLVSGFIITYVGQRESRVVFLVRRLLRIYPPLVASLAIIAVLNWIQGVPQPSLGHFAIAATLLNYIRVPEFVINGVAWSLVIEMIFYFACVAVLPWLQRRPVFGSASMLGFSLACILTCHNLGPSYFLFAVSASYVPFLVLGQLVYFRWSNRIGTAAFALLTVAAFYVAVLGIRVINTTFYAADNSYGVSVIYAYLVFVIAALLNDRMTVPLPFRWSAKISYSLYLVHGAVGFSLLEVFTPRIGYVPALILAVVGTVAVSATLFHLVESPAQDFARRLTRGRSGVIGDGAVALESVPPTLSG
jgi:peptidoglycan/LPS O-acetylase OafA/YrhL